MSADQPSLFDTAPPIEWTEPAIRPAEDKPDAGRERTEAEYIAPEEPQTQSLDARRSHLEDRLRECGDPEELEQVLAQLRELDPAGNWNGHIWTSLSDVGF